MPYIKKEEREKWDKIVGEVVEITKNLKLESIEGNLNYFITKILKSVYDPKYFNYNRAVGLLECIKQEFYRRDVASYEDKKIKDHGDVE